MDAVSFFLNNYFLANKGLITLLRLLNTEVKKKQWPHMSYIAPVNTEIDVLFLGVEKDHIQRQSVTMCSEKCSVLKACHPITHKWSADLHFPAHCSTSHLIRPFQVQLFEPFSGVSGAHWAARGHANEDMWRVLCSHSTQWGNVIMWILVKTSDQVKHSNSQHNSPIVCVSLHDISLHRNGLNYFNLLNTLHSLSNCTIVS